MMVLTKNKIINNNRDSDKAPFNFKAIQWGTMTVLIKI